MKIIFFLGNNPYYLSSAENNRTRSIIGALIKKGVEIEIKCFDGYQNKEEVILSKKIEIKYGISITYWAKYSKSNKLKRFIFRKCFQKKQVFAHLNQYVFDKDDIIFIGNSKYVYFVFDAILKVKQKIGFKLAHERSEHSVLGFGYPDSLEYKYYLNTVLPKIDKFIIMTKKIIREYENLTGKKNIFFHLPMTVDFDRFANVKVANSGKYIAYCGTMNNSKDGVLDLIKAFNIIKNDIPDIDLWLIGPKIPLEDFNKQKKFIEDNKISVRVLYLGSKDREEIPGLLAGAKALALCRPSTEQNKAGFPTKLGEYLATGTPVCITDIGEVSIYLQNQKSAYISKPGNVNEFADNLLKSITQEKAVAIGKEGRNVALEHFNPESYTEDLIEYFRV